MKEKTGYHVVLEDCMGVQSNESVLILTDDGKQSIGQALYETAKDLAGEAVLMVMEKRRVSGEEPPAAVAEAMKGFDVILCPTTTSLSHTNAKINAVKAGARMGSMPGITEDMFQQGAITANYQQVEARTLQMKALLTRAKTAVIIKEGYRLEMSLENRSGIASTGIYRKSGEAGNLPSGEAYIAPLEGTAQGEMIIDGSMVGIGILLSPLYVRLEAGRLVELKGDNSDRLQVLFEKEANRVLGELGIGTNPAARLTGIILEDEKIEGTVHIAFGTNISFGGINKASCHLDGVILNPTLYLDHELILDKGKPV